MWDALNCRSLSTKEPRIMFYLCDKRRWQETSCNISRFEPTNFFLTCACVRDVYLRDVTSAFV